MILQNFMFYYADSVFLPYSAQKMTRWIESMNINHTTAKEKSFLSTLLHSNNKMHPELRFKNSTYKQ